MHGEDDGTNKRPILEVMSNDVQRYVLDANVLFSLPKRDLILSLARSGLLQARWTVRILEETRLALEKRFLQKNRNQLRSRRNALMTVKNIDSFNPDALIEGDFSTPPSYINLPDTGDNHVLYAAIICQADCIITDNLRDFPKSYLEKFSLQVATADEIIARTIDNNRLISRVAIEKLRQGLRNPPVTMSELLEIWEKNHGLSKTVNAILKSEDAH